MPNGFQKTFPIDGFVLKRILTSAPELVNEDNVASVLRVGYDLEWAPQPSRFPSC
jgi:hypothetical protein